MAINKKTAPGAKSMKMSADDLKEMVTEAVKECMEGTKTMTEQDAPGATGEDIMEIIEAAVEAAADKRKARKEAGEDIPEEITPDEVIAEAAAILDSIETGEEDGTKADEEDTEEKADEEEAEAKAKPSKQRQTKRRAPSAPTQRKYADIYLSRAAARAPEKKKLPPEVQLARAVKCLDVFGRHDPEAAAFYAKKHYDDEDMAREFKALSATSPSAGGFLIPEIYLDEIIELLYAKTVIFELGARKVPMANGNLTIPKMTSGARATWGGEQRKIAKTQPAYGNIKLSAKRLEAIVPQTRELLMSTNYSADALFANDLTRRMELGLDFGAMFGTGGEFQPLGVAVNKDVETVDASSLGTELAATGGKLTADFPVWLVSTVMSKNIDDLSLGWTFNSMIEGYFKNLKTTTGDYIYRDEMNGGKLCGFPYKVSNQIATSAQKKSSIIFGNWADLLVGEQLGLETYTTLDGSWTDEEGAQHNAFEENLAATRALMYVDIAARHAESFIVVKNAAIV